MRIRKNRLKRKLKMLTVLLLLCVLLVVGLWAIESLAPLVQTAAMQQAQIITASEITRSARQEVINYAASCDYETLMSIERDEEGRVTLIAPDTMLLNAIIADTILAVEESILGVEEQCLSIPLGTITGSWLLSALGPDLSFRFRFHGVPKISVRDEIDAAGINQVRHRVYLDIDCELRLIVPFCHDTETVSCTVLLTEGIIVGYTPDTYIGLSVPE